jgi:osmotically-inducible protein OsmY
MQWRSKLIIMVSTGLVLAFSALAQDTNETPAKKSDPTPGANADNTERNVSDRSNETLTPIDQGNNKADLTTTAQIRKEIVAAKNMSVNAQNVKVITNAGKVTLRGPVDTAKEKRVIGEIAVRCASPGNVDNQLEVKVITDNSSLISQPTAPNKP